MDPGEPPPLGGAGRDAAAAMWAQRRDDQEGAAEDSGEQRSLAWERRGAEPGQSRWGEEEGREAVPLRGLDGLDELSPGRPFRKAGERSKGAATMELFPFASAPTADGGGPASGSHAPPSFSLFSLPEMFDASGAPRNTWTSFMTAAAMAPNSGFAAANLAEPVDPCAVVTGHRAPRPLGLAPRGRGAKSGRGSRPPRTAGAAGKGPARRSAGLPRPAQVGGDGSEGLSTPGLASSPSERGSVPYLSEAGDLGAGLSAGVVAGSAFGAASAGCMPSMIDRPSEFAMNTNDDSDNEFEMHCMVAMACTYGAQHEELYTKGPRRVSILPGIEWVMHTLNYLKICYSMFRMSIPLFYKLHDLLVTTYGLCSTSSFSSIEALAMFLWVVGGPQSFSQVEEKFERSSETISRKFHEILDCLYSLSKDIVKPKDSEFKEIHPRVQNARFHPHFNDCMGAIDGTHIPVIVPCKRVVAYTGRKGYTSQNVLAICDFDMGFTFIVAGWSGSVHDMRVFNQALQKYGHKFPHPPPGKYYLVDSGYPNRNGYLAPYKGMKYHLPEFQQGPRPSGKKELFNFNHSSLRNVIERGFGVLKIKFRILQDLPSYPIVKQTRIILACMALHNFIRESAMDDEEFDKCDQDENYMPIPTTNSYASQPGDEEGGMNFFRDTLADALFAMNV